MFVKTVYNQKLSDSSHVCRGLYSTEGVGREWVLAVGVVRDTSTWLECRLYLQLEIRDSRPQIWASKNDKDIVGSNCNSFEV